MSNESKHTPEPCRGCGERTEPAGGDWTYCRLCGDLTIHEWEAVNTGNDAFPWSVFNDDGEIVADVKRREDAMLIVVAHNTDPASELARLRRVEAAARALADKCDDIRGQNAAVDILLRKPLAAFRDADKE